MCAASGELQGIALIPGNLFAAIAIPKPVPQASTPKSTTPPTIASATL